MSGGEMIVPARKTLRFPVSLWLRTELGYVDRLLPLGNLGQTLVNLLWWRIPILITVIVQDTDLSFCNLKKLAYEVTMLGQETQMWSFYFSTFPFIFSTVLPFLFC